MCELFGIYILEKQVQYYFRIRIRDARCPPLKIRFSVLYSAFNTCYLFDWIYEILKYVRWVGDR